MLSSHRLTLSRWQSSSHDSVVNKARTTMEPMDTSLDVAGIGTAVENVPSISGIGPDSMPWNMVEQNSGDLIIQERASSFDNDGKQIERQPTSSQNHLRQSETPKGMFKPTLRVMARSISNPVSSLVEPSRKRIQLSNKPQTKIDHNRAASKKASRTTVHKPENGDLLPPVDLTEILQLLNNVKDTNVKGEVANVIEAIQNHVQQQRIGKGKSRSDQDKSCPKCPYKVARNCDLRKHLKRHQKPYGCTYPSCHKRFGAKSDWKRHENSQHFQQEVFRCVCGQFEHRKVALEEHLRERHKIVSENEIAQQVELLTIGKNYLGTFWCGFCERIVKLKSQWNEAWDERFNHIANHFEEEKKQIGDWLCLEQNARKKDQEKKLMDLQASEDAEEDVQEEEEQEDLDALGEDDDDSPFPHMLAQVPLASSSSIAPPPLPPPPPPLQPLSILPNPLFQQPGDTNYVAQEVLPARRHRQKRKTEMHRYCVRKQRQT